MTAVDLGYNKLFADPHGVFYGTEIKQHCERVARCRTGGKGRKKASRARKNYMDRTIKSLPWDNLAAIGVEDLTGIKEGKKGKSKKLRKKLATWTHRQARAGIEHQARVNRVRLVVYDPRNTSRCCPPCRHVAKENRKGEVFKCTRCHYTGDADTVGAMNGLVRTFQQLGAGYGRPASCGTS